MKNSEFFSDNQTAFSSEEPLFNSEARVVKKPNMIGFVVILSICLISIGLIIRSVLINNQPSNQPIAPNPTPSQLKTEETTKLDQQLVELKELIKAADPNIRDLSYPQLDDQILIID